MTAVKNTTEREEANTTSERDSRSSRNFCCERNMRYISGGSSGTISGSGTKNVQLRLSSDIHATLLYVAKMCSVSLADVVREALQVYLMHFHYTRQGKQLMYEDPETKNRVEVKIPGFTSRVRRGDLEQYWK